MTDFDVLIVGLGPTGATLAGLLGQRGVKVAVFDCLPDLYPLPRAIGLDHEAMRITQELGMADRVAAYVAPYKDSVYLGVDNEPIKRLGAMPGIHRLGWYPNYVFNQPAYENELRNRLKELPSVSLHFPAEVVDAGQDVDKGWVNVKLPNTTELTCFTGKYIVACDGGSSQMRSRLGIKLEDLKFDEAWLVVDALVNEDKLAELPKTNIQYCNANRPSTYVVLTENHRRWEIMLKEGDSLTSAFPEEELWPLLEQWIKPGDAKLWRAAAYRFHGLVAKDWRKQRIILAGDAAHMTPPFLAQGMVSGLRDAHNLAWKLDRVVKGLSSDRLLDSYEIERKPHVEKTILAAMDLGRIICEQDIELAKQRDSKLRDKNAGVIQTEYRQNLIPNLEAGILNNETQCAGEIFPQPKVKTSIFDGLLDDLSKCCFRLVTLGNLSNEQRQTYQELVSRLNGTLIEFNNYGLDLNELVELDPLIVPWMQEKELLAILVRPDHYIYSTATDHQQAQQQLNDLGNSLS